MDRKTVWAGRVFLFLAVTAIACPALAHRVTVFAWCEGDTVIAEGKFPGSGKAKDALIQVFDAGHRLLVEGKTDADGRFVFPKPRDASFVKIVMDAGMGHRGEWKLDAAELGSAPALSASVPPSAVDGSPPAAQQPARPAVGPDPIQRAVEKAMDARWGAIISRLEHIQARQEKVDFQNLLGAIGYIIGLMGLAAFWKNRSKGSRS